MGIRERVMLVHSSGSKNGETVKMRAISEEEEFYIDKKNYKDDIYFYGEVNLNDKDDLDTIRNYNFVDNKLRSMIFSNFNYNKGLYTAIEGVPKHGATTNPVEWFKYNHCLLGKPKRVIVYMNSFYDDVKFR